MLKYWLSCFATVSFVLLSCSKSQDSIDLSQQIFTDYFGNHISGEAKGQWGPADFSSREQNLFNDLDTADLTGTIKPDSTAGSFIFPNPFASVFQLRFVFSSGFNGQIEFKYVIVDGHMNIKDGGAIRIQSIADTNHPSNPSQSGPIILTPNIPDAKYRIYFTLSSASNPHFYKSWGNIQKSL